MTPSEASAASRLAAFRHPGFARYWAARELTTLDHLSAGRLTLGVGLGAPPGLEFGDFGPQDVLSVLEHARESRVE